MPLDHTQVKNLLLNAGCNTRDVVEYVRENMRNERDLAETRQKQRDKFAMAALTDINANRDWCGNPEIRARDAFAQADAMMIAREVKP